MEVGQFTEKLNKVSGHVYTIEEEIHLTDGLYEAELQHDNINVSTLAVYTGPKLTGERIGTYALSTPSLAPWKRTIRIHASVPAVYISYETDGDTVEADDVNQVQEEIVFTQEALNDEIGRAEKAEQELGESLGTEMERAETAERGLAAAIEEEKARAAHAEDIINGKLEAEAIRAMDAELGLSAVIDGEIGRAQTAEQWLSDAMAAETDRAIRKEGVIEAALQEEVARSRAAEEANAVAIAAEAIRASGAENALADGLNNESIRAKAAEESIGASLLAETARAKEAESANASSIASEVTRAKDKEKELQGSINANMLAVAAELSDRYTKDKVFTKEEVLEKFEELIGAAPDALDTLYELADALDNDPNFAATITNALSGKVDKEDGKVLSTNDYDNTEKAMVADMDIKKHTHGNKTILDKITQAMLDNLGAACDKTHGHDNKTILDAITQTLTDRWNAAWSHISDMVAHVTSTERTNWADAYNKRHEHSNKSILDAITQTLVDKWNGVANKVDKVDGKGLSTNDYTTTEKNKLAKIADEAEANVQSDWNVADSTSDAYVKNKPSSLPASDVYSWAKASLKPSYIWIEIGNRPTKVSEFTNDAGYLTELANITTAATQGEAANKTLSFGGTFVVLQATVDAKGRVTALSARTMTMPANPNTDTDTKNTAGSTNSTAKLFLVGAESQAANPQTYSRSAAYIGTDGCLYSNGTKVSVEGHTHDYVKKAPTWGELKGV